jgi:hypothetical protein
MAPRASQLTSTVGLAAFFAGCLLLASLGRSQQLILEDANTGLKEWGRIESVLTHPRCLNCHSVTDYPRQGDDRRPHGLGVLRGPDGHGVAPKCRACHQNANHAASGIPGARNWHMAPRALAWENGAGKPAYGGAICASLKQPGEDGEADYERLIEYLQFAPSVLWAWEPGVQPGGANRATPPLPHHAFVDAIKRWISAGAPCPPMGE